MPYNPQTWNNDDPATPISAERLAHMEEGIEGIDDHIDETISAHNASAVSVTGNGNNVSGHVQSSLNAIDADKASVASLTAYQLVTGKGAASGYASLDSGTKVPTAQLATGTANSASYLRGDRTWATIPTGAGGSFQYDLVADFSADPTGGTFSDTALAAATTAIRAAMTMTATSPNGITLFIPRGYYKFASTWDLQQISGLTIIGEGTQTDLNHNGATVLVYTGTGPRGIDCRSSAGLTFNGVQVSFNAATFSGILVDFSHLSTILPDTSNCYFRNGNLRGIGTRGGPSGNGGTGNLLASCSRLIAFTGAIICGVENTHFANAGRAIEGCMTADPLASYSNSMIVHNCSFNWITQPAIMNPGQGWNITNNTFEGFQTGSGLSVDDSPAVGADHNGNTRSSGCVFSGNWCGDCAPDYWLDLYSAYGWEISGNYFSRIGAAALAYIDNPYIRLYLAGGISITGNEFSVEASGGTVHPPIFDGNSNVYAGETDEAVRGVTFTGNNIRNGTLPTNYTGLSDISIISNDWPLSQTAPGNGYYITDSSATVITSGSGGASVANEIHALDYFTGNGSAESLAAIDAFKAAINGKVVIFDRPSSYYNFANIGSTGFVFTSPTIIRGSGCGNDQVTGGITPCKLTFPNGVTAFTFSGNGSQGGASGSSISDILIQGPINPALGTNDGIRVRAGSFLATNVQVTGFNRDCWNIDTDNTTNANNSSLRNCHAYFAKRHGFYTVGTNSNVITFTNCDANNSVQYGFYTGGPPTNGGSGANGGYTNTFLGCHCSFNQGGSWFDDGNGNTYIGCYSEDTRSTYANSWRLVIGANSTDGILLGIAFGGFPVVFTAPNTTALSRWFIRNPSRYLPTAAEAGTPVITGSRGGNAALASLLTAQANAWLIQDSSS